jgi:PAS domain-containing protein
MATRFTDDLFHNTEGSDFIVRKRIPLAIQIFLIFVIAFAAIYLTACAMRNTGSAKLFISTLTLTISTLAWFTIYYSARLRDLVLATEFQNTMLASAAQLSTRFCLITKRDGSIVYIDQGFQKMFPHFLQSNDRNVDGLLDAAGVSRDTISKIVLLLQHAKSDRVLLPLRDGSGAITQFMMSIDILPRPKGYFLLRGRNYVEKRGAEAGSASQESSMDLGLAQALGLLPAGILVTNNGGVITYANRVLEEWLGFAPGEMLSQSFKTSQIIYQYSGKEVGRPLNADFDGDVVLQRKDRSLITMQIRQVAFGKPPALSAIIDMAGAVKKK